MSNLNICGDDFLFETISCASCGTEGREIDGFIFDDDTQKHFCSPDCQAEFLQTLICEDEGER